MIAPGAFAIATPRGLRLSPCGAVIRPAETDAPATRAAWWLWVHVHRCENCRSYLSGHWPSLLAVILSWRRV